MDGEVSCTVTSVPLAGSRAAAVSSVSSMQNFGVYAHRTINEDDYSFYISRQEVTVNDNGECSMTIDYEWPDDKSQLQFHAYYPYGSDNIVLPERAGDTFSFDYQVPGDMVAQEDLMVASSSVFSGDAYTSVPLRFNHICTQVTVRLDDGLEDFAIQSVSFVGVKYKGTYDYTDGWTLDNSGTTMRGAAADAADGAFTFMMLPQTTPANAELRVTIHNHISGTDQTYFMRLGQEWLQG